MIARSLLLVFFVAAAAGAPPSESIAAKFDWQDTIDQAKAAGVDYRATLAKAERGDVKGLAELFRVTRRVDGAGKDSHNTVLRQLLGQLGDARFSRALAQQSPELRNAVIQALDYDFRMTWRRRYPRTYKLGYHNQALITE